MDNRYLLTSSMNEKEARSLSRFYVDLEDMWRRLGINEAVGLYFIQRPDGSFRSPGPWCQALIEAAEKEQDYEYASRIRDDAEFWRTYKPRRTGWRRFIPRSIIPWGRK